MRAKEKLKLRHISGKARLPFRALILLLVNSVLKKSEPNVSFQIIIQKKSSTKKKLYFITLYLPPQLIQQQIQLHLLLFRKCNHQISLFHFVSIDFT